MTPAATAAAGARARRSAGAALPRRVAPQRPRRVSGPARPAPARPVRPARHAAPAIALAPPLGARFVRGAGQLVDHRLLDRLIRGRAWIAMVAFALIGIVAMQVALLKLNTGISRSIERASTLQLQNTALEAQISALASGDRVTTAAGSVGMVYPPAGDVGYLDWSPRDAVRAARALAAGLAQPRAPSALTAASTAGGGATSSVLTPASSGSGASTGAASATSAAAAAAPSSATGAGAATAATPASAGPSGSVAAAGAAGSSPPASAGAAGGSGAHPLGTGTAGGAGAGSAAPAGAGGGPAAGVAGAAAYPGSTGGR